jgi:hypothetical protein
MRLRVRASGCTPRSASSNLVACLSLRPLYLNLRHMYISHTGTGHGADERNGFFGGLAEGVGVREGRSLFFVETWVLCSRLLYVIRLQL